MFPEVCWRSCLKLALTFEQRTMVPPSGLLVRLLLLSVLASLVETLAARRVGPGLFSWLSATNRKSANKNQLREASWRSCLKLALFKVTILTTAQPSDGVELLSTANGSLRSDPARATRVA